MKIFFHVLNIIRYIWEYKNQTEQFQWLNYVAYPPCISKNTLFFSMMLQHMHQIILHHLFKCTYVVFVIWIFTTHMKLHNILWPSLPFKWKHGDSKEESTCLRTLANISIRKSRKIIMLVNVNVTISMWYSIIVLEMNSILIIFSAVRPRLGIVLWGDLLLL